MKALFKWLLKPRKKHGGDLDMILHIEDDYYHYSYKPSKELSIYYLAQI